MTARDRRQCAYLGPRGTFCEQAVSALYPADELEPVAYPTIGSAIDAVRTGLAERAVVPIESSVEGGVNATLDELTAEPPLVIKAEVIVPVEFALLVRPDTTLADIKVVGGHPVAQPQCRRWLAEHLPDAQWRQALSNADAAWQVADGELDAALAGSFAATYYQLEVLASGVHDRAGAVTRFVELGAPGPLPEPTASDRTSVIAFLADDHPGALMDILSQFAVRGVNLSRIESRPTGEGIGRYCFFIDCEGHILLPSVGEALMGLRRTCSGVRFLGSYATAELPAGDAPATKTAAEAGRTAAEAGRTTTGKFTAAAAWLEQIRSGGPGNPLLQVGARGALLRVLLGRHHARRQRSAHLLQLRPRGHLLREQGGLDAVEQALEPADELRLSDPQLGLARNLLFGERQGQPLELVHELGSEPVLEFLDRAGVDLLEPGPALLVQGRGLDLLEQLPDHASDPHDLGRLLDHLGDRPLALRLLSVGLDGDAVWPHHHDLGWRLRARRPVVWRPVVVVHGP